MIVKHKCSLAFDLDSQCKIVRHSSRSYRYISFDLVDRVVYTMTRIYTRIIQDKSCFTTIKQWPKA